MTKKKGKEYKLTATDSKGKEWFVTLEWLKQKLGLPDYTFYNNALSRESRLNKLIKQNAFLRLLHEPQIIAYFYNEILEIIKVRTKQFYKSTIYQKVSAFSLWNDREKAWNMLVEEDRIVRGNGGYYRYDSTTTRNT